MSTSQASETQVCCIYCGAVQTHRVCEPCFGQNRGCDGPKGYHDRDCWLDKRVCAFVLACICSARNTEPCPSHSQGSRT